MLDRVKNILKKEKVLCFIGMLVTITVYLLGFRIHKRGFVGYGIVLCYVKYLSKGKNQWMIYLLAGVMVLKLVLDLNYRYMDIGVLLVVYFLILSIYYIVKDMSSYKYIQILSVILIIPLVISVNNYINKDKLIKDRGLEKRIKIVLGKKGYLEKLTSSDLENVRSIFIHTMDNVRNLEGIEKLKNLEKLYNIEGHFKNKEKLALLPNLREVTIENSRTKDLSFINNLKNLEELWISCSKIDNTFIIDDLPKLKRLEMDGIDLDDLSLVKNLKALEELRFSYSEIKSVKGIENLSDLKRLEIHHMTIEDLSDIRKLKHLEAMDIEHSHVEDLDLLKNISNLK